MTPLKETQDDDPVGLWLRYQSIPAPRLTCAVRLAMPGGVLMLRTNRAELAAYVRRHCRHLIHCGSVMADVEAQVVCLPGRNWPPVRPCGRDEKLTTDSLQTFQSFSQSGMVCTWQPPTLMGVLLQSKSARPQIRILAAELNPRWLPPAIKRLRVRSDGEPIKHPEVLDLVFCLLARSQGFTILHGAVLEKNGKGVMLLGESGCGKTTAALALVRGGFRLVTDEYAVLWNRGRHRGRCGGILVPPMVVGRVVRPLERLEQTLHQPKTSRKTAFPVSASQVRSSPVELAAMISLIRPETRLVQHQAARLAPEAAFFVLMSQLRDPISSGRSESCEAMLDLVNKIHAYRVIAGSELKTFPPFVERLATDGASNQSLRP